MDPTCPMCGEPLVATLSLSVNGAFDHAEFYCAACPATIRVATLIR